VREIVEQGVQEVVDLVKEYNRINEKFSEPMSDDEMNTLIERQGAVQEKLDAMDAWTLTAGSKWQWMPSAVRQVIHR